MFQAGSFYSRSQNKMSALVAAMREPFSRFSAYACLSFYALMLVLPFVQPVHTSPLTSFYSEWLAFVLGIAALHVLILPGFWAEPQIPRSALWLFGLAAAIAVQTLWIHHYYTAQPLVPALYIVWAALLAVSAVWFRNRLGLQTTIDTLAWFALVGGVLLAFSALVEFFEIPGWNAVWVARRQSLGIHGNIGQQNHLATYLTLASTALAYLYAQRKLSTVTSVALCLIFAFAIAVTTSRAALIYSAAICLLAGAAYGKTRTDHSFRLLKVSGLVLFLLVCSQYLLPHVAVWAREMLTALGIDTRDYGILTTLEKLGDVAGYTLRLSEWHKAWTIFLESPWLGVGISQYGWYSFLHQAQPVFADVLKPQLFSHPHNLFLETLAELGVVGLLLLLSLLVGWFLQFRKRWLEPVNWIVVTWLTVLLIHSNLEYPLSYSYFLGPAAFLLGLGDFRTIKIKFSPRLGQTTAVVALFFAWAILIAAFRGYIIMENTNELTIGANPTGAAQAMSDVSRNPLLAPWAEQMIATYGEPQEDMLREQAAFTDRVMHFRPISQNVYRNISYLTLAGRTNEAHDLLRHAAVVYPGYLPEYYCSLQTARGWDVAALIDQIRNLLPDSTVCPRALTQ